MNPTPPTRESHQPTAQFTLADLEKLATGESAAHSAKPRKAAAHSATRKDTRHRLQFQFWLNTKNKADDELALELLALKQQRRYTATIRDGIRLVMDLRRGRLGVLRELFPWVLEQ